MQTRLGHSDCHVPAANEMRLSIRHAGATSFKPPDIGAQHHSLGCTTANTIFRPPPNYLPLANVPFKLLQGSSSTALSKVALGLDEDAPSKCITCGAHGSPFGAKVAYFADFVPAFDSKDRESI